jgi:hypothetical protein
LLFEGPRFSKWEKIVTKLLKSSRGVLPLGFLLMAFPALHVTKAAGIQGAWVQQDAAPAAPASDLSGWFFNGDSQFLFPAFPDPSQIWTSAENIALLNSWASLVGAAAEDPLALAQLTGLGMLNSTGVSGSQMNLSSAQQITEIAPEPDLLSFLGGGIALLGLFTASRMRVRRQTRRLKIIGSLCPVMKV